MNQAIGTEKVWRAIARREMRRRETNQQAKGILAKLKKWAETGEDFELDIGSTSRDTKIPEGSLALLLDGSDALNALAKASDQPGVLLPLLLAYQQYRQGTRKA